MQLYANARVGSSQDFVYCYGANGGTKLFGNIKAPTVFGYPLSRYYTLKDFGPVSIYMEFVNMGG